MGNRKLKLSDVEWEEFVLDEVFEISSTKSGIDKNKRNGKKGEIPYLTRTENNNGIDDFISIQQNYLLNEGNVISVGLDTQTVFYQKNNFYTGQNIQILNNNFLNRHNSQFLKVTLNNVMSKFNWGGNGATLSRLKRSKIFLPIDKLKLPNWQFMEDYMKQHENELLQKVKRYYTEKLLTNLIVTGNLNNTEWKEFEIGEVCEIKSGVRLTKNDMEKGKTPFVGATDSNNGITEFVGNINQSLDENVLGVNYNGSVVENFYHPYECVFSDDVKRLHLKEIPNDKYVFLFLKTSILAQKQKFQYGYKFNAERMRRQKFLLPINSKGQINYDFMKKVMINYEKKSLETVLEYYNIAGKPHFVERERESNS